MLKFLFLAETSFPILNKMCFLWAIANTTRKTESNHTSKRESNYTSITTTPQILLWVGHSVHVITISREFYALKI